MKGGENIDRITTTERVEGRRERKGKKSVHIRMYGEITNKEKRTKNSYLHVSLHVHTTYTYIYLHTHLNQSPQEERNEIGTNINEDENRPSGISEARRSIAVEASPGTLQENVGL